jgi:hypothetical protein
VVVDSQVGDQDYVVSRWGRCDAESLLANFRPASESGTALIDLRDATWVEPIGLVAIASYASAQAEGGREVYLAGPRDFHVANYLSRMRLGLAIEELGGEHDLNPVREQDQADTLLELRRFEDETGAEELAALVYERVVAPSGDAVAGALHKSICEIGSNVPQHSGESFGFMAAQVTHGGHKIQFAVGDCGQGMTASLAPLGARTDEDALRMALEEGVTSTGQAGRGQGIRETRRLVNGLGGSVAMITGRARRTVWTTVARRTTASAFFPGTLLQGEVPC